MKKWLEGNRPVKLAGLIYTIIAVVIVLTAWADGLSVGSLRPTISEFVGLRTWTIIAYFFCVVAIDALVFYYIFKNPMLKLKKIVYCIVFTCVLGCAIFPYNLARSEAVSLVHNINAFSVLGVSTIALVLGLVRPNNKAQRIFSISALLYTLVFIATYVVFALEPILNTLFIWQNICIYCIIIELCLEKHITN